MTTVYDVPAEPLITRLAAELRANPALAPPEWAVFVKTGTHREKGPTSPAWWHTRTAAILRRVYLNGPIGTDRLAAWFGGKTDRGSKPFRAASGSRAIARTAVKQLEAANLLQRAKNRGRVVTPKGRSLLDNLSHQVLTELAAKRPELTKYL